MFSWSFIASSTSTRRASASTEVTSASGNRLPQATTPWCSRNATISYSSSRVTTSTSRSLPATSGSMSARRCSSTSTDLTGKRDASRARTTLGPSAMNTPRSFSYRLRSSVSFRVR